MDKTQQRNPTPQYYSSPRWSQEIYDCSVPMCLDQYNLCGYNCLYCFSQYQRGIGNTREVWNKRILRHVDVAKIVRIFVQAPKGSQFGPYIQQRKVMQWGGLSDPFCVLEQKQGIGLNLLRFFRSIEYPITFSTKGVWWLDDPRYTELFRDADFWNMKISIISTDSHLSRHIEKGVPTPLERLRAIEKCAKLNKGGVTLRLRPFIIGVSEKTCRELIHAAASAGASAVSTEFFCFEQRASHLRQQYQQLSSLLGFDIAEFYRTYSKGSGYLRLNRNIKRRYVDMMQEACQHAKVRLYISDADFKERCCNGSCCGLPISWNYSRGQTTEALLIAKREGEVRWSDIAWDLKYTQGFLRRLAQDFNTRNSETDAKYYWHSMYDYLRLIWNTPSSQKSPYGLFRGILTPKGKDEQGDVIYEYRPDRT